MIKVIHQYLIFNILWTKKYPSWFYFHHLMFHVCVCMLNVKIYWFPLKIWLHPLYQGAVSIRKIGHTLIFCFHRLNHPRHFWQGWINKIFYWKPTNLQISFNPWGGKPISKMFNFLKSFFSWCDTIHFVANISWEQKFTTLRDKKEHE